MSRTIEVTGPPGVGKSRYITHQLGHLEAYQGFYPKHYGRLREAAVATGQLMRLSLCRDLSMRQMLWLLRMARKYEESLWVRANAFRHALLKFGLTRFVEQEIVVDEGVSHIPFLLQLAGEDIEEFVRLFSGHLRRKAIILLVPGSDEALTQRLNSRGHKRARSPERLQQLVQENLRVLVCYRQALDRHGIAYRPVTLR